MSKSLQYEDTITVENLDVMVEVIQIKKKLCTLQFFLVTPEGKKAYAFEPRVLAIGDTAQTHGFHGKIDVTMGHEQV